MIRNKVVKKNFTIRIDEILFKKLRIVAINESRSASSKVSILIRDYIIKYEAEHGEIKIDVN